MMLNTQTPFQCLRVLLFFCALAMIGLNAHSAIQYVPAKNAEPAYISLPAKGMTLLKFEHGKILRVRHNSAELQVEADPDKGEAYVKVIGGRSGVVSFYVVNDEYTIPIIAKIDRKMAAAGSIVIQNPAPLKPVSVPTMTPPPVPPELSAAHHVRQIKETLIAVMGADGRSRGFITTELPYHALVTDGLEQVKIRSHVNSLHTVDEYVIKNTKNTNLGLSESNFYKKGVLAVVLEKPVLSYGESAKLYLVSLTSNK